MMETDRGVSVLITVKFAIIDLPSLQKVMGRVLLSFSFLLFQSMAQPRLFSWLVESTLYFFPRREKKDSVSFWDFQVSVKPKTSLLTSFMKARIPSLFFRPSGVESSLIERRFHRPMLILDIFEG